MPGVRTGFKVLEPEADFWPKNRKVGQKISRNIRTTNSSELPFSTSSRSHVKYIHFGKVLGHFGDPFPSFPCHTSISSKCVRTGKQYLHGIFLTFSRPKKLLIWSGYSLSICTFLVHLSKNTEISKKVLRKCCYTWSVLEVFYFQCFPDFSPSPTDGRTNARSHSSGRNHGPSSRRNKDIPFMGNGLRCAPVLPPSLQWCQPHSCVTLLWAINHATFSRSSETLIKHMRLL